MDKLNRYRAAIRQILTDYAALANHSMPRCGRETLLVFDADRDHYLVQNVGWDGNKRIRGTPIFVRIRDEKVWLEDDWTQEEIADQLIRAGVPRQDLVFAFHHPALRNSEEPAVA